jgi:DNA invertase Pin-like site-specific DNA recombinase/DNA-directed RNA polymerase subunit RPC12/RpoP
MAKDDVVQAHEPILESESGLTTQREGIEILFELAGQGLIDYVYVYTLDRLGRNAVEDLYVLYRLRQLGVVVRTLNREYDLSDPMDGLLAMAELSPGQVESIRIGERTGRGKLEKFLQGKWVGPVPPAYVRNSEGKLKKIPEQVDVVRAMFNEYCRTGSLKETLSTINSQYSSKHGNFSFDRLRRILSNSIYRGRAHWGKHELDAPQYAIIDSDLFEKTQLLLEKSNKRKHCARAGKNPKSLLDELITKFGTATIMRFVPSLRPHCTRHSDNTEMRRNGTKPSKIAGFRLPNFRCGACGHETTIPSQRELERILAALSCPRCRSTELNATMEPDGRDDSREYVCRGCGISFVVRTAGSNGIAAGNQKYTFNQKGSLNAGQSFDDGTRALERVPRILHTLTKFGLNLEPPAFDYLKEVKEVTVETISGSILTKLRERALAGGLITKQLLVELLSPIYSKTARHS